MNFSRCRDAVLWVGLMQKNPLFECMFPKGRDLSATALVTDDDRAITYSDLFSASAKMANALKSVGVERGDRIVVQVSKSPEAVILYLAAVRSGVVFIPINPAYSRAETDFIVSDCDPRLFVTDELSTHSPSLGHVDNVALLTGSNSLGELAAASASEFDTAGREDDDLWSGLID